jgi:hypothetical protein
MLKGSCCCGAIRFELSAAPSMMGTCHCSRRRKVGASAIVFVRREDLLWRQGREHVELYKPDHPYKYGRCFCKVCGTSLGEILSEEPVFPIAANAPDTDVGIKNQFHEFTSEKPDWCQICDDAPQSAGHPAS